MSDGVGKRRRSKLHKSILYPVHPWHFKIAPEAPSISFERKMSPNTEKNKVSGHFSERERVMDVASQP